MAIHKNPLFLYLILPHSLLEYHTTSSFKFKSNVKIFMSCMTNGLPYYPRIVTKLNVFQQERV